MIPSFFFHLLLGHGKIIAGVSKAWVGNSSNKPIDLTRYPDLSTYSSHVSNKSNPHNVTCSQIGAATSNHNHSNYSTTSHNHSGSGVLPTHIEMISQTPFIDFHYGSSTADYTSRIIADRAGHLDISGSINVQGAISVGDPATTRSNLGAAAINHTHSGMGLNVVIKENISIAASKITTVSMGMSCKLIILVYSSGWTFYNSHQPYIVLQGKTISWISYSTSNQQVSVSITYTNDQLQFDWTRCNSAPNRMTAIGLY